MSRRFSDRAAGYFGRVGWARRGRGRGRALGVGYFKQGWNWNGKAHFCLSNSVYQNVFLNGMLSIKTLF